MVHERFCLARDNAAELERMNSFMSRAVAHTRLPQDTLKAQQWAEGVTDEDVAAVFYAIEHDGVDITRSPMSGHWLADPGQMPWNSRHRATLLGRKLTNAVNEMIRTGLLRHWVQRTPAGEVDRLIPARVHMADPDDPRWAACRPPMENIGPMRTRLARDLALVDCLECEGTLRHGGPRLVREL